MELRELRAFVTVVEEGRFAAAAQRLNLSQPAISHTISGLEKHCGVDLLERTKGGVVTTEAGKILLAEARGVLARYDQAMAAISGRYNDGATLRIGVPSGLPPGLLNGALATISATYPSTAISVRQLCTSQQIEALSSGQQDLGLLRHRPANVGLDATLVADEPLGVLLSERVAERLGASHNLKLEELAGLDWQGFPREASPVWYDELTATLRSYGLRIEPSTSYTSEMIPEVVLASVSLGRSFALAPRSVADSLPSPVTWRRLSGDPLRRRTWASWPAASRRRDLGDLVALLEEHLHDDEPIASASDMNGSRSHPPRGAATPLAS